MPVHEPTCFQAFDRDFESVAFVKTCQVKHWNSADAASKQLLHRHAATALLAFGNDDLVNAVTFDQFKDG